MLSLMCVAMLAQATAATAVAATPSEVPLSEAERLFGDGRAAFKVGDFARACEAFKRSHEVQPALGVLLNLGTCLEKQGKVASAWLRFNEATVWAQRTHEGEREKFAREHAASLKPRVSWLSLSASREVEVKVDGSTPLVLQPGNPTSVPVDLGAHVVEAVAAGFESWSSHIGIDKEGATSFVTVPALKSLAPPLLSASGEPALRGDVGAPPPPPPLVVVQSAQPRHGATALVVAGGAVALVGAIGLGWSAVTYQNLQKQRADGSDLQVQVSRESFNQLGWIYPTSWVLLGVGAAAAATGTVLTVRGSSVAPVVSPVLHAGGGGVSVSGVF